MIRSTVRRRLSAAAVCSLLSLTVTGAALPVAAAPVPVAVPGAVSTTTTAATTSVADTLEVVGGPRLGRSGIQADLPAGTPRPPRIRAAGWVVADLDTGEVLAARQAHRQLAPASTLKILTVLALLPELDPDARYTATDGDAAIDGSKVGLVPGSRYTVQDLLHGLMLGSGNDAAHALGNLVGGNARAAALMTETAARLGARDTRVVNTSGLDAPGQVSSAYDLALFARAALKEPQIRRLVRATRYSFPAQGTSFGARRKHFEIQNHNRLLRNYQGATGVKNGYTVQARGSFVGSATRGGHRYVVALIRAEGITWHHARDLLDWAFAVRDQARPVGTLVGPDAAGTGPGAAPQAVPSPADTSGSGSSASGLAVMRTTSRLVSALVDHRFEGLAWAGVLLLAGCCAVTLRRRQRLLRRSAVSPGRQPNHARNHPTYPYR